MRHYIQLWVGLQTACITLFFLKGYQVLELGWFSDKTGILGILVGLFIIFLIKNIFDHISLKKDISHLDQLMGKIKGTIQNTDSDHIIDLPEGHLRNVYNCIQKNSRGTIDMEEALSYWIWPIERRYEFMRHGSSVIVTLGLIGTLAGLIMTIGGLEGVMSHLNAEGDSSSFSEELSQTLGGMSTAFYTTFFGTILGSAYLKTMALLNYIAGLSAVRELRHFFLTEHVIFHDDITPRHQDDSMRALLEGMNRLTQALEAKSTSLK